MSRVIPTTLIALVVLITGAACSGLAGEPEIVATIPPRPTQAELPVEAPSINPSLTLGQQIYAENCTSCHGETGAGDGELVLSGEVPMEVDFTAPEANDTVTPAFWYDVITNGRLETLMPPWSGSLNEMERWSVTMYLYTLTYPEALITQGADVYAAACADCHGENGQGTADGAALTDLVDRTDDALLAQITNGVGEMPAFAEQLSSSEREAALAFVRTINAVSNVPQEMAEVPSNALQTASISGTVAHGTSDGVVPDGLTAQLHLFGGELGEVAFDAPVAPDGSYRFEEIPVAPAHTLVVSVEYNDGTFVSDFVPGTDVAANLDLPVTIYDLTYDPGVLRVASLVSQVFVQQETLQVFEIIEIWNDSDRIYMGTDSDDDGVNSNQTVSFTLPEGANFVDFSGSGRYSLSEDGRVVTDSLPVLPGEPHVVHIAYTMPFADRVNITQTMDYPLRGSVEVHAQASELSVEGGTLSPIGSYQPTANTTLNAYGTSVDLPAGGTFAYDVVGIAGATTASTNQQGLLPWVLLGLGVVMVFGSGGFLLLDYRRRQRASVASESAGTPDKDELIRKIAALDKAYQAGEVDEDAYRAKREALKRQVAKLMQDD